MLDFVKDLIGFKLIDNIYLKILNWIFLFIYHLTIILI